MNSQNAQIQALINGINEVLAKNSPRLPWVMSNDAMQQRQVLEQARQYLITLQQQLEQEQLGLSTASLQSTQVMATTGTQPPAESAQQVLQAVLQEMNYWRVNMLQPLRSEVDLLQRQREMLTQEIRQLEVQRQQNLTQSQGASIQNQQLIEFLRAAMGQMQANLSSQVTQMIADLPQQSALPAADRSGEPTHLAALSPAERLAQMQQMQTQSDQLMLKLDSTLQIIFESLNRNVQTYQDSLEQGLNRMHNLGQQGEAMFALLVNRLAQQLGREASTFLQAAETAQTPESANSPAADGSPGSNPASSTVDTFTQDFKVADFLSQPPAAPDRTTPVMQPSAPFNLSEEVLDVAELEEALATDLAADPTLGSLNQELSQLDLDSPSLETTVEPYELFAGDQPLAAPLPGGTSQAVDSSTNQPGGELDSALDLLNQLSAEMQAGVKLEGESPGEFAPFDPTNSVSELATDLAPDLTPELITAPEALYDEVFYSNRAPESTEAPQSSPQPQSETRDPMTLAEDWLGDLGAPTGQLLEQPAAPSTASVNQSLESFLLDPSSPTASGGDLFATFGRSSTAPEPTPEPMPQGGTAADLVQDWAAIQESRRPPEVLSVGEAPSANLDLGMTVDAANVTANSPQSGQANREDRGTVTLEGLEQLFEDLPNASAATDGTNLFAADLFDLDVAAEAEKKNY
ncbi:MAG: hypothetical protein ACKO7W_05775 [Elainella sp.]